METDSIRELVKLLRTNAFKAPARLAILLYLLVKEEAFFTDLVEALDLTPGNLWSHLKRLEREGYVVIRHAITDRPRVVVRLTDKGYNEIIDLVIKIRAIWSKLNL